MSKHIVNKDAIRTSTQVVSLQETNDFVTLTTSDGSEVDVGLVIGADGVRSCVRDAIERTSFGKVQSDTCMLPCDLFPRGFILPDITHY